MKRVFERWHLIIQIIRGWVRLWWCRRQRWPRAASHHVTCNICVVRMSARIKPTSLNCIFSPVPHLSDTVTKGKISVTNLLSGILHFVEWWRKVSAGGRVFGEGVSVSWQPLVLFFLWCDRIIEGFHSHRCWRSRVLGKRVSFVTSALILWNFVSFEQE